MPAGRWRTWRWPASLVRVGKIGKTQDYASEVRLPLHGSSGVLRAVAFLQQPGLGPIVGVDLAPALQ